MILYDGIVFSLQRTGGISVYFNELIKRAVNDYPDLKLCLYPHANKILETKLIRQNIINLKPRLNILIERYLNFQKNCNYNNKLFHSTYYRVQNNKEIKNVLTVHDFTYEKFVKGLKKMVHVAQKKKAISKAAHIICVSENTKKDLLYFYADSIKGEVSVIHNGVSDLFHSLNLSETKEKKYVLYVGARRGYKSFSTVVEALASIEAVALVIVGGPLLSEKEKIDLNYVLGNRYVYKPYVDAKALNALYNEALCLIYPSLYEGFGIPILEAMKAGCPVIATKSSSIPEVAGDSAVLLDFPNSSAIADAVCRLRNSKFRDEIISKGIINSSKFSWDKCYSETKAVYNSLI
jgi:mannosyltransferase